jgi:DNA repair exonuclease SbcCD ATPase subunit
MKPPSRFVTTFVLVLLTAGCVIAIALNQNAIARLRLDKQSLLAESQEVQRLNRENQDLDRLRQINQEGDALRQENKDLPKLRNEIRQLRLQLADLDKLRAENQRLLAQPKSSAANAAPAAVPSDFIPKAALTDVGLDTPEAAIQTFHAARCRGDVKRLCECFEPQVDPNSQDTERMRQELVKEMSKFPGYRIAEKKVVSPNEVILGLQSSVGGQIMPMTLSRIGNEWRIRQ